MNICHSPSSSAAPKPTKANHRWAGTSRLLFHTAQPPPVCSQTCESRLVDDLDPAPHPLVPHAAKFVARHQALTGCLEARVEAGDIARHQHQVDVRASDQEAVHDVGAGGTERNRRI